MLASSPPKAALGDYTITYGYDIFLPPTVRGGYRGDRENFRLVARRAADLVAGEPVPVDEPLKITRARSVPDRHRLHAVTHLVEVRRFGGLCAAIALLMHSNKSVIGVGCN